MNKTKGFCNMLVISMLFITVGQSQIDTTKVEELNEVVVTDSRFKLKRESSGKVITKISAQDLEKLQGQSIAEIIGRTVGVEINGVRSNAGQNLSYIIRGGRNRQVLVLIDGVMVTDPSQIANDYDLRLLNADQVESIEILKGASSTLYGTGAATAVINIKLKEATKNGFNLSLMNSLGTNQTSKEDTYAIEDFRNSFAINGRQNAFDYLVSFGHQFTNGLSAVSNGTEKDAFNSYHSNIKLGYSFNDDFKVNTYASLDRYKADFDDSFGLIDANNLSITKQYRLGISPIFKYNNGSFLINAAFNNVEREIESSYPSKFNAQGIIIDAYNRYNFNDKFYTVLGINYQKNQMESFSIPYGETDFNQSISPDNAHFTITDPYANVVYVSKSGLNINLGLRLNNHSEYGTHMVYSINPSFTKNLDTGYLKGLISYSSAFITPSLYQLFEPNYGNVELKPEENETFEIGGELSIKAYATLSLVYFNRKERQFIDFKDTGGFIFQYRNIEETFTASGLEFVANFSAFKNLNFNTNVTYTTVDKELSLRIPEIKINAKVDYQVSKKTLVSLSYQFNDDRDDVFFNNSTFESETINLEPYMLLDFYISHKILRDKLTLFGNITNVFNEEYQELFGYNTRGRGFNLGINLKL